VQVFGGSLTVADPETSVRKMMRAKNYSARQAEWQLHYILLWLLLPAMTLLLVLFLNGVYGWSPFHIRAADWVILLLFSGMIYFSGALVLLLIVALAIWLRRDIGPVVVGASRVQTFSQHRGEHGDALLGERPRQVLAVPAATGL
jgi:hypothetical protein